MGVISIIRVILKAAELAKLIKNVFKTNTSRQALWRGILL
jgi:hypothetical protein